MSKTIDNYEKETVGEKAVSKLKVLGLGFVGAIVGSLPYIVLLACGYSSIASMILAGAGAMIFYAGIGHFSGKSFVDHLILIFDSLFSAVLVWCLTYAYHYAPKWDIEGLEKMGNFEKLFYAMRHAKLDQISGFYLITDGGYLSFWTCMISCAVFAVIGMYIAFIFVVISNKGENKKKEAKK